VAICICLVASDCVNNITVGQIMVQDGMGSTYVASLFKGSNGVRVSGSQVSLAHNYRAYFTGSCIDHFTPEIFKQYSLLDKTIAFTADVSSVGCGCNAAFYLSSMPAYNQNQQPDPTKCNDYYCDANNVCGVWCPEMDLFEANSRALQVTPHICSAPQGKYYPHCDGGGCGQNTRSINPNAYGFGSNYMINTQNVFRVSINFRTSNNQLTQITTTLSQDAKSFTMIHDANRCGSGYLPQLTDALRNGMVVIMSHWSGANGGAMSWLDVPPCDVNTPCDTSGTAIFRDVQVS